MRTCEGYEPQRVECPLPALNRIDFIPLSAGGKGNYLYCCLTHAAEWMDVQPVVVDGERYSIRVTELVMEVAK